MEFSPTMVMKINVKVNGYFDGASHLQLLVSVNTRRSGLNYPCLKRVNREIDVSMCGQNVFFHFFFKRGDRTYVVVFLSYGCLGIIQGLDTLSMRRKKTINVIENGTLDSKVREYDCRKMYHLVSFISGHNCCAYILKCTIS